MLKMKTSPNKNWYDNNPFFENKLDYDVFAESMMMDADAGNLPIALQVKQPETLTMNDVRCFSKRFMEDTGLNIEFSLSTCNHCDKLHCVMIVNEFPETEMEDVNNELQSSTSPTENW